MTLLNDLNNMVDEIKIKQEQQNLEIKKKNIIKYLTYQKNYLIKFMKKI